MTELTFTHTDRGNGRYYFKCPNKQVYCLAPNYLGELEMLFCSKDGEPNYPVDDYKIVAYPEELLGNAG